MPQAKIRASNGGASLDGAALEKALAQGSFDQSSPQLVGMVKASEKAGHINFAPAGCGSWVDVPSGMISEAQHIGHQTCEDRSHPVFRLSLVEPSDRQAKVLLELLSARTALPLSTMMAPALSGLFGAGSHMALTRTNIAEMRTSQCTSSCVGSTLVCACPVYVPGLGTAYIVYACGTCINDPVFTA
jgi:hypothetical protein